MAPAATSEERWEWTVEGDESPTASPISLTDGGYPRSATVFRMYSKTCCCLSLSTLTPFGLVGLSIIEQEFATKHLFGVAREPALTCA